MNDVNNLIGTNPLTKVSYTYDLKGIVNELNERLGKVIDEIYKFEENLEASSGLTKILEEELSAVKFEDVSDKIEFAEKKPEKHGEKIKSAKYIFKTHAELLKHTQRYNILNNFFEKCVRRAYMEGAYNELSEEQKFYYNLNLVNLFKEQEVVMYTKSDKINGLVKKTVKLVTPKTMLAIIDHLYNSEGKVCMDIINEISSKSGVNKAAISRAYQTLAERDIIEIFKNNNKDCIKLKKYDFTIEKIGDEDHTILYPDNIEYPTKKLLFSVFKSYKHLKNAIELARDTTFLDKFLSRSLNLGLFKNLRESKDILYQGYYSAIKELLEDKDIKGYIKYAGFSEFIGMLVGLKCAYALIRCSSNLEASDIPELASVKNDLYLEKLYENCGGELEFVTETEDGKIKKSLSEWW